MKSTVNILATMLIVCGLWSCNPNPNGQYTITAIEPRNGQTEIIDRLVSNLHNSSYDLKFDNKRLQLTSAKTGSLLTLYQTGVFGPHTIYTGSIARHDTTYYYKVTQDSTIRLEVSVTTPTKQLAVGPVSITSTALSGAPIASVICYLSKD